MSKRRRVPVLQGLMDETVSTARRKMDVQSASLGTAAREIEVLARRDYGLPLRKTFTRSEIREMVSEARRTVWPHLNEVPVTVGSPTEFTRRWSAMGVEFSLTRLSSDEELALLGFYVRKSPGLKRPLICVNTAHHPAAIGAAFAHEMGHHLTAEMFGPKEEPHFLLYSGYGNHLEDPWELAADLLVSLGVLPLTSARSSLGRKRNPRRPAHSSKVDSGSSSAEMLSYFSDQYGLTLDRNISGANRLQYLAGMIHYTKLREALLKEYDL